MGHTDLYIYALECHNHLTCNLDYRAWFLYCAIVHACTSHQMKCNKCRYQSLVFCEIWKWLINANMQDDTKYKWDTMLMQGRYTLFLHVANLSNTIILPTSYFLLPSSTAIWVQSLWKSIYIFHKLGIKFHMTSFW